MLQKLKVNLQFQLKSLFHVDAFIYWSSCVYRPFSHSQCVFCLFEHIDAYRDHDWHSPSTKWEYKLAIKKYLLFYIRYSFLNLLAICRCGGTNINFGPWIHINDERLCLKSSLLVGSLTAPQQSILDVWRCRDRL